MWLAQHGYPRLLNHLDAAARTRTHSLQLWQQHTGRTLNELWATYAAAPAVQLTYR